MLTFTLMAGGKHHYLWSCAWLFVQEYKRTNSGLPWLEKEDIANCRELGALESKGKIVCGNKNAKFGF